MFDYEMLDDIDRQVAEDVAYFNDVAAGSDYAELDFNSGYVTFVVNGHSFIVRVNDTDVARFVEAYDEYLYDLVTFDEFASGVKSVEA